MISPRELFRTFASIPSWSSLEAARVDQKDRSTGGACCSATAANTTGIRIPRQKFVSRCRDTMKLTNISRGVSYESYLNRDVSVKSKTSQRRSRRYRSSCMGRLVGEDGNQCRRLVSDAKLRVLICSAIFFSDENVDERESENQRGSFGPDILCCQRSSSQTHRQRS